MNCARRGKAESRMRQTKLALGIGCETGVDTGELIALAERVLKDANAESGDLAGIYSIDLRVNEAAIYAVAARLGVKAFFYDAARLEAETPRLKNPSSRGCGDREHGGGF